MICGLCSVLNFWDQRQCRCMGTCMLHRRVYLLICQPYIFELIRCRKLTWWPAWHMHMHRDFTSTSKLLFASFSERVLVQNVSHENDLIFMWMNVQVTHIFIPIVLHKNLFHHRGKSKLRIGVFIHELAQGAFDSFPHRTNLSPDEMCFSILWLYLIIIFTHNSVLRHNHKFHMQ